MAIFSDFGVIDFGRFWPTVEWPVSNDPVVGGAQIQKTTKNWYFLWNGHSVVRDLVDHIGNPNLGWALSAPGLVMGQIFSQDTDALFYAQLLSGVANLWEFGEVVVKSGVWQSGDCLYTELCGFSAFSVHWLVVSFRRMFCGERISPLGMNELETDLRSLARCGHQWMLM